MRLTALVQMEVRIRQSSAQRAAWHWTAHVGKEVAEAS